LFGDETDNIFFQPENNFMKFSTSYQYYMIRIVLTVIVVCR